MSLLLFAGNALCLLACYEALACCADVGEDKAAPDVSGNHKAARKIRHSQHGSWFVHGEGFMRWKEFPDQPLWLYGSPGCGKTIICSSVIDDLTMHCERNPSFACAYFFFDGRNLEGELSIQEKYIRSLIRQLWDYLGRMPAALLGIYSTRSSHPQPSIEALQDTLQTIIGDFQEVYIVIDVLDACTDRDELLVWVKNLAGWKEGKLHLILSSRPELDIDDHWAALDYFERIRFAGGSGNPDIVNYVDDMLPENGKWTPETHALGTAKVFRGDIPAHALQGSDADDLKALSHWSKNSPRLPVSASNVVQDHATTPS
ncbi:hypothetical protein FIBSPDRAFT_938505 [Athelia psychrophila]|uniref:Nephrocystin 3-like N-terminal domain-containing protein n=1 Tax=Athelia psychrophila TaxID=1759441 RepID=A0A165YB33_9AGAM|nr:hypothetical protein FIBSPDRAFT_938505 [Fibularhizoctonia sp. CBS 109695]